MEFYGIDGHSITLADAAKENILGDLKLWADALMHCSEAINHLHQRNYIHCDLKPDNVVFNKVGEDYLPVIIDFGKMKKVNFAQKKKLSEREKETYYKYHKHIAPEVVEGKQPPSKASDIYAFGQLISLVCYYQRYKEISTIARMCIRGTPDKRPNIQELINAFKLVSS